MIKLLIADDHPVFRAGIKALLSLTDGIQIVGEATDGREALRMALDVKPDVLLMDMEMPYMNGFEVTKQLKAANSPVQILVLSAHSDPNYVIGVMEAGVAGYLLKDESLPVVAKSIKKVFSGGVSLSRRISDLIVSSRARTQTQDREIHAQMKHLVELGLTPHLFKVLTLVAEGMTNDEISAQLHKSPHTVRNQVDKLRAIAECTWRPSLVTWYWRNHIDLLNAAEFKRVYELTARAG